MAKKFGQGHVSAMLRLGLAELRNAANPSKDSVADKDMGLYGSATQGEIADARDGSKATSMKDLREYAQEATKDVEKGRDGPEQDRGMGM